MMGLRKVFAALLLTITLPVSLLTSWNHGIWSTYLNQNFYHSDFFEETLYEIAIDQITLQITSKINELRKYVSQEDISEQLKVLLPVTIVQTIIDNLFKQFEQKPFPNEITISFEEIKKNIPGVVNNIAKLVEEKTGKAIPINVLKKEFGSQIDGMLPNEFKVPLNQLYQGFPPKKQIFIKFMLEKGITFYRLGLWIAWGAILAIMGLLLFSKDALRWIGITLALDGLSILTVSQVLKEGLAQAFQQTEWSKEAITLLQPIFKNISIMAFSILAISILLIISYHCLKPHHART